MKSKKEIWMEIHEEMEDAKKHFGIKSEYGEFFIPGDRMMDYLQESERIYAEHEAELNEAIKREQNNPEKSL